MSIVNKTLRLLMLVSLVCATAPILAGNVKFLKDSALSKMSNEDMEILRAAARNALDYTADGQPRRWENQQTGASGILTPLDTSEQDGTSCRRLEIFNDVRGETGRSVFEFCRQPDGTWRIPAQRSTNK